MRAASPNWLRLNSSEMRTSACPAASNNGAEASTGSPRPSCSAARCASNSAQYARDTAGATAKAPSQFPTKSCASHHSRKRPSLSCCPATSPARSSRRSRVPAPCVLESDSRVAPCLKSARRRAPAALPCRALDKLDACPSALSASHAAAALLSCALNGVCRASGGTSAPVKWLATSSSKLDAPPGASANSQIAASARSEGVAVVGASDATACRATVDPFPARALIAKCAPSCPFSSNQPPPCFPSPAPIKAGRPLAAAEATAQGASRSPLSPNAAAAIVGASASSADHSLTVLSRDVETNVNGLLGCETSA
mmetsp:Transcript_37083/g.92302  ORF Transcript_37083/g.92302 Transcript_37083/m.92302 type:complete len:312 (-) Transcript_37083:2115-3050(-)